MQWRAVTSFALMVLAPAGGADELEPIVITAPRIERDILDTPAAVDRVDRREIQQGRAGRTLDEALRQVPGFYFQNQYNNAQGLRISTRGFGARAPFGIRGIHLRVDGFPATLPDGQAQTDGIALEAVDRIEVIRGPAAVAYGNAAGGVIDVTTADGRDTAYSPTIELEAGAFDDREVTLQAGGADADWAYHTSLNTRRVDGHREQSFTERTRFNGKLTKRLGDERELQTVITLLDNPEAEDPGGLTAEQVAADRTQATEAAKRLDAGQQAEQARLGVRWRDRGAGPGTLTLRTFYTRREFEQQLPFAQGPSLLGFDRDFFGGAAEYAVDTGVGGLPVRVVAGLEANRQIDQRFRFDVAADGTVGRQTVDERQQATEWGVFARADIAATERFDVSAAVRFDRVRFTIDDEAPSDGDDSGSRRFDETSGRVGAVYTLAPGHRVYGNVSTGFETPTFTEFADPDGTGGFNPSIEPQQALNRELGVRGRFNGRLRYDLAVFRVDVDDELVVFNEPNEPDFFENAGETRREGVELGLDWTLSRRWALAASYTYSDFRFERFVDRDGNDFSGNRLPGLPENNVFVEADWTGPGGRYGRLGVRWVDSVYADNANSVRVDDYATVDARLGRRLPWGDHRVDAWFGVDNLTDTEYIANVRVNASDGAFFEPAPGRTWLAGVEIGF